jgi:hypothetical protein
MYPMPVARSSPLTFHSLAQAVFLGLAAAVQLSSCTETPTMATRHQYQHDLGLDQHALDKHDLDHSLDSN